jgi:hypothetical protein
MRVPFLFNNFSPTLVLRFFFFFFNVFKYFWFCLKLCLGVLACFIYSNTFHIIRKLNCLYAESGDHQGTRTNYLVQD